MTQQRSGVDAATVAGLAAETPRDEIKQRQGPGGRQLDYVDARFVMDRLDTVVGPENWQDRYEDRHDASVRGGIGILVDGEWIWKWDVGDPSDIEPEKGAFSGAFKRAGVKWGIARDLYGKRPTTQGAVGAPRPAAPAPSPAAGRGSPSPRPAASTVPPEPDWMGSSPTETARTGRMAPAQGEDAYYQEYGTCPDHEVMWRHIPAGTSKTTGKAYNAFWACPERGCKEKPTQKWTELAQVTA